MAKRKLPILSEAKSRAVIRAICKRHGVSIELLQQMVEIQREHLGRGKQIGISQDFSAAIADFLEEGGN